jgi:hypothetical protein
MPALQFMEFSCSSHETAQVTSKSKRTRRWVLGLAAAGLAARNPAFAGAREPNAKLKSSGDVTRAADAILSSAIAAAGGEAALSNARVLTWTGEASVFAGDRRIDLGVETLVEPFSYARSDTWLRGQGRSTLRTLEIDGDAGWLTQGGARTPMTEAMVRHERQQYAIYGLMRLMPLLEPGVGLLRRADTPDGLERLAVKHPKAARLWAPGCAGRAACAFSRRGSLISPSISRPSRRG